MVRSSMVAMAIMCIVMVALAPLGEAKIGCGQVASSVGPCITYLKGTGKSPGGPCCDGVKKLSSLAQSTPDRQAACSCLKSQSTAISGIDFTRAKGLPGMCGVSIPYAISPSIDCSKVK